MLALIHVEYAKHSGYRRLESRPRPLARDVTKLAEPLDPVAAPYFPFRRPPPPREEGGTRSRATISRRYARRPLRALVLAKTDKHCSGMILAWFTGTNFLKPLRRRGRRGHIAVAVITIAGVLNRHTATPPQCPFHEGFRSFSNRNMRRRVAVADVQETLALSTLWRCGGSKLFSGQVARKGVLELRELIALWGSVASADGARLDLERR